MAAVGDQLRDAREHQNLSIRDVANATNIRSDHIRAMEAEEWQVFGARVYVKGFVRTYAQHLKMDVPSVLGELDRQLNQEASEEEEYKSGAVSEDAHRRIRSGILDSLMLGVSRVRWSIALPVLIVLGIALAMGMGAFRWKQDRDPMEGLPPGLYEGALPLQPLPTGGGAATQLPLPTNRMADKP